MCAFAIGCAGARSDGEPISESEPTRSSIVAPNTALPPLEMPATARVSGASHVLKVRVLEAGTLAETTDDGEATYDYAWLQITGTHYGRVDAIVPPYHERFPVFHMTGFASSDARGEAPPSPISDLLGRTGRELIFIGDLPTARNSARGDVPAFFDEQGYGQYIVATHGLTAPENVQRVMAIFGPM